MKKNEIILEVAKTTNLTRSKAAKAYETIIKIIKTSLIKGEDVTLRGFATIKVVRTKERVSRLYNKSVKIPAQNKVKFKTCQELKKLMNEK